MVWVHPIVGNERLDAESWRCDFYKRWRCSTPNSRNPTMKHFSLFKPFVMNLIVLVSATTYVHDLFCNKIVIVLLIREKLLTKGTCDKKLLHYRFELTTCWKELLCCRGWLNTPYLLEACVCAKSPISHSVFTCEWFRSPPPTFSQNSKAVPLPPCRRQGDRKYNYRVGHEKVARVKANNMRSRTASGGGGGGGRNADSTTVD
jgi:hypothetical protein